MTPPLKEAITRLYDVFARYPINSTMEHCDHCITDKEVRELAARPLRKLTAGEADAYAFDAITLWGSVEDFKHFLPRLLELASTDSTFLTDHEVIFGKLSHGNWLDWPAVEVAAVRTYLHALWQAVLTEPNPGSDPDTTLCAIGRAEADLRPYLEAWLACDTLTAAQRLAEFIDKNLPSMLKKNKLSNAFWQDRESQAQAVRDWLRSLAVPRKLEEMALAHTEFRGAEAIMSAADRLRALDSRLGDA